MLLYGSVVLYVYLFTAVFISASSDFKISLLVNQPLDATSPWSEIASILNKITHSFRQKSQQLFRAVTTANSYLRNPCQVVKVIQFNASRPVNENPQSTRAVVGSSDKQ